MRLLLTYILGKHVTCRRTQLRRDLIEESLCLLWKEEIADCAQHHSDQQTYHQYAAISNCDVLKEKTFVF